jgi:hypothetical protein
MIGRTRRFGLKILTDAAGTSNSGTEPDISDLAGIQITMTLEQLLRLVPRFREGLHRTLNGTVETPAIAIQLTKVNERVMDCECPSMEAIVGGQKIAGILIDGGSGVNVISMGTCRQLGITIWEPCKFWLRMANGSLVRPIGMIPDLEMVVQGHAFTISVVIMDLPHQDAYPILLGRLWLRSARMKYDWPKNVLTFRRGGQKIRIHTTKGRIPDKAAAPVYAESVKMLEGLTEEEVDTFM